MPSSKSSANTVSSTSAERALVAAAQARGAAVRRLRGYTRPGRLTLLDAVIALRERELLSRRDGAFRDAPCVDVGVGEWPWTTVETARRFRAVAPQLHVIGVELDPDRLRHARRFSESGLEFRQGSFELPLAAGEQPRLVRALNVLREYDEDQAEAAHLKLGAALLTGGLVIEGTSSASGGVTCVHLLRKRAPDALTREGLLFATDFSQGFAPWLFRDRLPRDLRRRCKPGHPVHAFLATWTRAFDAARSSGLRESSALFALSALLLARELGGIAHDPALIARGVLLWEPPDGVPPARAERR